MQILGQQMNIMTIKMLAAGASIGGTDLNFKRDCLLKLDEELATSKNLPYLAWLNPDTKEVVEFHIYVIEEGCLKKRSHEKYMGHWFYSEQQPDGSWIHHFNNESFLYPYQLRVYIREFTKR